MTPRAANLFRVLVTGANGFVGTALCAALAGRGHSVRRALRKPAAADGACQDVVVGDISPATEWGEALRNTDVVIHLAARTHVMRETAPVPLAAYRHINVGATVKLAQAAAATGIRRMIFISSIKVNGEKTGPQPFTEQDTPRPEDDYGVSKWEAEQALQQVAASSGIETVVLRPPLLYGAGVKGNFLTLMRAIDRGLPLPLASIHNQRSLLYVGNLVDAIILCLDSTAAAGKTYLLADDSGVSTPDLIRGIGHALGRPARLLAFPPALLQLAGMAIGKAGVVSRLLGSLQVDSAKIRRELGWRPPFDMAQGLHHATEWYHRSLHANSPT